MKSDHYIHFRDILIIIAGFFGAAWFFFDYGNHDVKSSAEMNFSKKEVLYKVEKLFKELDYQHIDLKKTINFKSNSSLIDSLQEVRGRHNLVSEMRSGNDDFYPFFYWDVNINRNGLEWAQENDLYVSYSEEGKLVEFEASPSIIRAQSPFNRLIIREGMLNGVANKAKEDSLITALVNYQYLETDNIPILDGLTLQGLLDAYNQLVTKISEAQLVESIWGLSEYYIAKSHWSNFDIQRDSLSFTAEEGIRVASAHYTITDPGMGIASNLEVEILPAGSLKKMYVTTPGDNFSSGVDGNEVRSAVLLIMLFAFAVWVLVIFYLRIKAKVVDTKSSLIVALIAGFLLPVGILLQDIINLTFLYENIDPSALIQRIIQFGFIGAAGSIVFFVMTAVGDSITRQFLPEKLESFDLVRSGLINNKPVGWVVVRGISFGLFGLGLFSLMLWLVPSAVIESKVEITDTYLLLRPLWIVIMSGIVGLGLMLILFLLIANQVYGVTNQKWYLPITGAVLFGILMPLGFISGYVEGAIISAVVGFYIGYIYMRTDFITTVVTFITFLLIMDISETWVVTGSSEAIVFYIIISFFVILFSGGIYAIAKGQDINILPSYIPEYMEEIAQEQRVKQELHIARNVQHSFLPTTIPKVQNFDLAGYCDPAQETGGDYYDMIKLSDEKIAIAIGDVSGKGIQAAFYMTFAKGVIHSLCSILDNPMELISKANQLFNDNATRGTFISMIYGILDTKDKTFKFIRAGHNPILLKKKNGDMEWLQPKGTAIGMMKNASFEKGAEEMVIQMNSEIECLVLYTDGITEAANKKNEFYGEDRLLRIVKNANYTTSNDLIDIIIKDVSKFTGAAEQHDDITCVVIKAN